VTRTFALEAGRLSERPARVTGRLSIDALAPGSWKLVSLAFDEPAPPVPEVTLRVEGTRAAGSSGCNRYTSMLKPGESPGDVTFGGAAGTRMLCPPEPMAIEARYLKQLAAVKKFGFLGGRLALTYDTATGAGVMLFERVVADTP